MIKVITKITTNNYQNSNNKKKKKKKKTPPYIQKSLSSKRTSPIKLQMLNILVVKLLDTFFNIKPKWCHSLKCASVLVFPFKRIRWVSFIYKGETATTGGIKMVKQMLLHTCSSLTMLSRVTFITVPS